MKKKTIALGVDDFKKIIDGNHYLVDKSLFIKEVIEDGAEVVLLPRPRRWGKTLNMTMLKYFFEKTETSNRHLFHSLAVAQDEEVMEHQGRYPVICLTLKDVKQMTWQDSFKMIKTIVSQEFKRHEYLYSNEKLDQKEKELFRLITNEEADLDLLSKSLHILSMHLHKHYNQEPIILIDEYDAPVIAGFENGYYKEIVNFMQTFLGRALKSNLSLKKAVLTGILRVSKESIFSGFNNPKVCTLLSNKYAAHFGFSESEVQAIIAYYGPHENDDQVKLWYNNYHVGSSHSMYNPWSIISYLENDRRLSPHWMNSANNNLIKEIIQKSPSDVKADLELLIRGKILEKPVIEFVTFNALYSNPDVIFSFLFLTGYLSFEKLYMKNNREHFSLIIPNEEVLFYHQQIITQWLEETLDFSIYQNMLKELIKGDIKEFKRIFERVVQQSLSYHDVSGKEPEKFYHMFVLGMLVCLQESHEVKSNRESGTGRYDVMIIPKDTTKIGIIIEFKVAYNETDQALQEATKEALTQIQEKNYKAELEARGITEIINLAIVFAGKRVLVQQG